MIADGVLRLSSERNFNDAQRYELFYTIGRKLQPDFFINDRGRYLLADKDFRSYFEIFFLSIIGRITQCCWKMNEMLRLLPSVAGDLAECGVFEGAGAYQLCQFAREHDRKVHLFDSFQG